MVATVTILLLWLGFAGSHIWLSSLRIRPRLVTLLGERPFQGLYSVIALAFFIPMVRTYFAHKHAGPLLWSLPLGWPLLSVMYVGMGLAFVLLIAALVRPSPAGVVAGDPTPRGVYRITRHPLFMALALFGLLHLLPNGNAADLVFFSGFVWFALIGGWHQDRRKLATSAPGFRRFHEATPFLPFTGHDTLIGMRELSPVVVGLGIFVAVIVRYFHASWFGG
jgi:uncharacterized membrane protein